MQRPAFRFELVYQSTRSRARVGRLHTPHGVVDTPGFVGVGTNGTIKSLTAHQTLACGLQLMFCNTYHLLLHPGPDVIREAGGLHKFTGYSGPIITDSGGFQVFSLAYGEVDEELKGRRGRAPSPSLVTKISEEGVLFKSYRDGSPVLLTPESSVQAQKAYGADIIVPLDELPPYSTDPRRLRQALDRTHRWELRSLATHQADPCSQAMYAIVHGGVDRAMRRESLELLCGHAFDGLAVGGSLGKDREEMLGMLGYLAPMLPAHLPRHLLGIGDLSSLDGCVPLGFDTFDSAYPTRASRHGLLLTRAGPMQVRSTRHRHTHGPIEDGCTCWTCQNHTLSYVHHLFQAHELSGLTLATVHNLHFMLQHMHDVRTAILGGLL